MEVEELSPLTQHFSLTPTKGATEEDDGFVDILENDLKVNNLSLSGPSLPPSLGSPRKEGSAPLARLMTSFQCQKQNWR